MRVRPEHWQPFFADCVLPLDTRWELHAAESQDAINGIDLLAKVRGPFFLVAAAVRHERWYSRGLWERPLSECADVITSDQMVGTVSHDQPLDDKALLSSPT